MSNDESEGSTEVDVVVEIPRGSRNKYEVDEDGIVRLDRRVLGPVAFPADYGYLPGTRASDGDSLDTILLLTEPAYPGVRVRSRPIGAFRLAIGDATEDKIVCIAVSDPTYNHWYDLDALSEAATEELGAFFTMYRRLERGGTPEVSKRLRARETREVIEAASRAYAKHRRSS